MSKFIPLVNLLGDVQYWNIDSIDMISPDKDEGLNVYFKRASNHMQVKDQESVTLLDQLLSENVYKLNQKTLEELMEENKL